MKKVVLVAPYWPSFRDDFTQAFQKGLAEEGIELQLVVGTPKIAKVVKKSAMNGSFTTQCETTNVGFGRVSVQWVKGLIAEIRKAKPDLVIIHPRVAILNFYLLSVYLSLAGIPKVFWDGGFERLDLGGATRGIKRLLKSIQEFRATAFVTYSQNFAAKREVRNPGVAVFPAQNTIFVEKVAEEMTLRQPEIEGLRLVYFGAITRDKRIEKVMDAAKILAGEGIDVRFHIVGSGKYESALKAYAAEAGIEEWTIFEGPKYREDLWRFVSDANIDLFCLPGIGGLAVNEAMACGLPAISTPGDGTVGDLISDGVSGWLLDYNATAQTIAEHCRSYVRRSPEEKMAMRIAARAEILQRAPLSGMADGFIGACKYGLGMA